MKVIPIDQVTDRELVEMAWQKRAPAEATRWSRGRLIRYLEAHAPRERKPRMKKNLGVREYVFGLLRRVVGYTPDGLPIGMSYAKIVRAAQRKFPDSAVDDRHAVWYANKMRADGHIIPVHRERSRWI